MSWRGVGHAGSRKNIDWCTGSVTKLWIFFRPAIIIDIDRDLVRRRTRALQSLAGSQRRIALGGRATMFPSLSD